MAAHDSAATWMMNIFAGSPFLISLLSTVASLPFFLFTLSAGPLADKVDRRNLICSIQVGLAALAAGLALPGGLHLLNPYFILSQGAMALGGVIWGLTASIAATSYTLLGAAALFLMSLFLAGRFSIEFGGNLEQRLSRDSSIDVEPEAVAPIALANELLAA